MFDPVPTTRLLLRCVEPRDAPATSEMMTSEVSRWVAHWPVPFTVAMAEARIAKAREAAARGDGLPFAVERLRGGLIGWIMVNRTVGKPRRAPFGYWFGAAHHGQGFMREAGPSAVAAGLRSLDVDAIEAAVQPGNEASIAVLRHCGFIRNGEGMVAASARQREEFCLFFEFNRLGPDMPVAPGGDARTQAKSGSSRGDGC